MVGTGIEAARTVLRGAWPTWRGFGRFGGATFFVAFALVLGLAVFLAAAAFFGAAFLAAGFGAAFWVAFLAAGFFTAAFFGAAFLTVFFAAGFAGVFFAAVFFAVDFFAGAFFAEVFTFGAFLADALTAGAFFAEVFTAGAFFVVFFLAFVFVADFVAMGDLASIGLQKGRLRQPIVGFWVRQTVVPAIMPHACGAIAGRLRALSSQQMLTHPV